jgi:hypothetical protein
MKSFDVNDVKFKNNPFIEVPIDILMSSDKVFKDKYAKPKVEYLNEIFSRKYSALSSFKGVYVFVVNKENNLILEDNFFKETYIYREVKQDEYECVGSISSKLKCNPDRRPGDAEVTLEDKKVFYCGRSDDLFSRTKEHLTNDTYSGTMSLKLGFGSRKWVRKHLKCFIVLLNISKRKQLEKYIHNTYGTYFGENK